MAEEDICVAAFFHTKGKNVVTENEFLMGVSMNMRWMPYGDAERLLEHLVTNGFVEKDGEFVRPLININAIDVPVGYRPAASLIPAFSEVPGKTAKTTSPNANSVKAKDGTADAGEDVFRRLMDRAIAMGMERKDFLSSCRTIQKRLNVEVEVAAVIVLRDNGTDVSGFMDDVHDAVVRR